MRKDFDVYNDLKSPVIIILGEASVPVAQQIQVVLPDALVYGLASRTQSAQFTYDNFGDTVREFFTSGTPIIGICAAGILIRTLAPLLTNKWQEPPVLAIAEDGSAVVPLLGGLQGVNDLARQIAAILNVSPAITTTGDIRFRTALLSPPTGYHLANPEAAKTFLADLLAGATVQLLGNAPWIKASKLPLTPDGQLRIQVTEHNITPQQDSLVYHPATLAIGVTGDLSTEPDEAIALVQHTLTQAQLSDKAIAGVFALLTDANHSGIQAVAQAFQVPLRFFPATERETPPPESLAHLAVGASGQLIVSGEYCAIGKALQPFNAQLIGQSQGKLVVIGTGPGSADWMSPEVKEILQSATDWVGYKTYLNLAEPLRKPHIMRHESDNRVELDRARIALDLATQGRSVVIISSGDPGIYGMAAAVLEVMDREAKPEWEGIEIQICPGISAMQAAAAQVGAPLGHDFCVISLSDILKPWEIVAQRISAAAQADFAIAFYNPVSKQRTWQLEKAKEILLQWRSPQTPVVLARNLGRVGQTVMVKSLEQLAIEDADMRTVILIGSSKTRIIQQHQGKQWVYTPRHY